MQFAEVLLILTSATITNPGPKEFYVMDCMQVVMGLLKSYLK